MNNEVSVFIFMYAKLKHVLTSVMQGDKIKPYIKKRGEDLFMSYKDIVRELKRNGWKKRRQSGSHVIYEKDGKIVPIPYRKDIPPGTLASIKRITGVYF